MMVSNEYLLKLDQVWWRTLLCPKELMGEMRMLHIKKQAGYIGKDNPDPWANFRMAERIGLTAFQGCMARWGDKVIRCENLMKDSDNEQVGESLKDTLMDLAAYRLIAICLLEEENVNLG